mmetsp:Transcript_10053/g.31960  ORF Transcript_10053/g.31960 Transcript_10053/m.31960 type:complete len:140 (+) Transcript_10053:41-460(+)
MKFNSVRLIEGEGRAGVLGHEAACDAERRMCCCQKTSVIATAVPRHVPFTPDTALMHVELSHSDYEIAQGNTPRAVTENPRPTGPVVAQTMALFSAMRDELVNRDGTASAYETGRQPHSVKITSATPLLPKDLEPDTFN